MTGKQIAAVVSNVVLIASSVGGGVYMVRQSQDIKRETTATTAIMLESSNASYKTGDRFAVSVKMDAGKLPVGYIYADITYDASLLDAVSVSPGEFFQKPTILQETIDPTAGHITYSLTIPPGQPPVIAKEIAAVIIFQAKHSGVGNISFGPQTQAAAHQGAENVLQSKNILSLTIN